MARTRYHIFENEQEYPYFMTCTVMGWLPVFTRPEATQILLDSWKHLQQQSQFRLLGYVILENHLHLIAQSPNLVKSMQSFKSWTARQILTLLEEQRAYVLLDQFSRLKLAHKTESNSQFWQEGSQPKQIRTDEMMWQKLEYLHMNPVKRGYVDDQIHWRYSSARNYCGQPGLIDVATNWI
ncbi:MAG TPA: transposase [Planctomicrobium sp.]|nr:transposase [Planctomicrobium sp.]